MGGDLDRFDPDTLTQFRMSQLPLPPEVEVLLVIWRDRLPTGTELERYMSQDPDAVVIYATQPSIKRGERLAASVWVSKEAIEDHGQMVAVAPVLDVPVKLAGYPARHARHFEHGGCPDGGHDGLCRADFVQDAAAITKIALGPHRELVILQLVQPGIRSAKPQ